MKHIVEQSTHAAYRHLLYVAMVAIRNSGDFSARVSLNPLAWRTYYLRSRVNAGIADWLHNLADFSARDFERFDEERFWQEHGTLCKHFPGHRLQRYREIFESYRQGDVYV